MNEIAEKIVDACNSNYDANKGNCNKFVMAVASEFNVTLSGLADDIVDQIQTDGWIKLNDGIDAKNKADEGLFVVAGLKAADTIPKAVHGHVVVVLSGPLAQDKYPTAMWGSLAGILPSPGKDTINYSWNRASRDRVIYAARQI